MHLGALASFCCACVEPLEAHRIRCVNRTPVNAAVGLVDDFGSERNCGESA